jgi:hypothetical protein
MERIEISKKTAIVLCIICLMLCGCGDLKTKLGLERRPPDALSAVFLPSKPWEIPLTANPTLNPGPNATGETNLNANDQMILNCIRRST